MKTKKIVIELFLIIIATLFLISCSKDKEPITPPTTNGGNNINNPSTGTVIDVDGNVYNTIVIGTQEWMTENLRTTKYCNGDPVPNVTDSSQWNSLSTGAWVFYNNNSQYENPYGKLYNWYSVSDVRNICPCSWHVPTHTEWNVLINYLGGDSLAGGKMKSIGTQLWLYPNINATNESGFSGIPGGYLIASGSFNFVGAGGYWWSSTEITPGLAWSSFLLYNSGIAYINGSSNMKNGASIRCIKD